MGSDMSAPETGDALNLAGILNTLDGVVDTPGRLLVMTSNHPEKLDPALIRPGRIDKMFRLSYMVGEQACHMMAHYFQQELELELAARSWPVECAVPSAEAFAACWTATATPRP